MLEGLDESLDHGEVEEVVGDYEVVALLAEGYEIEATGFCGGADADARVGETDGDGVGDCQVSLGGALVAIYGVGGETGAGHEAVQQGSTPGTPPPD